MHQWTDLILHAPRLQQCRCAETNERRHPCLRPCVGAGAEVDSIDYWAGEVRRLECEIVDARKRALASPACASYFVFFSSQKDAAIAAQTNIHPEDGRSFRVVEAPGPEEVWHRSLSWVLLVLASKNALSNHEISTLIKSESAEE